jgi:hypothetical protein
MYDIGHLGLKRGLKITPHNQEKSKIGKENCRWKL